MSGTLQEMHGQDYVARWPHFVAAHFAIGIGNFVSAMWKAGLIPQEDITRIGAAIHNREVVPEIGAITAETAALVGDQIMAFKEEAFTASLQTRCDICGYELDGSGECDSCRPA